MTIIALGIALSVGLSVAFLPVQAVVAAVLLVTVASIGSARAVAFSAVLLAASLGLVRRGLAYPDGRIDNDVLVLLPVTLLLLLILLGGEGQATGAGPQAKYPAALAAVLVVVMPLSLLLTSRTSTQDLFDVLAQAIALSAIAAIALGRVPDLWPVLWRTLPYVGAVVGAYGLVQFVSLPAWDRAWMLASGLTSVGRAIPFQVRLFGMSESPGPYAALIGLCVVASLHRALTGRGGAAGAWAALTFALTVPLVLTGVRLAYLATALAAMLLFVRYTRGARRTLPIVFLVGAVFLVQAVVSRFGATSTILTSERLGAGGLARDQSVIARLSLLGRIPEAITNPFGTDASFRLDNHLIDVLVQYGIIAGLALALLYISMLRRLSRESRPETAAAAVFLIAFSLGTNVLVSSTAVLVALVFGSLIRGAGPCIERAAQQ